MHELGHNLGLKHAGEDGRRYADKSGYMGSTYRGELTPLMCFNGAQNHQLGWYSKNEEYIDPDDGEFDGDLVTFVDVAKVKEGTPLLLNIDDLHIQYNKKKDHNRGTRKCKDGVTITQFTPANTWIQACLEEGDEYEEYGLKIKFCKAGTKGDNNDIDYAKMSISPIEGGKDFCGGDGKKKGKGVEEESGDGSDDAFDDDDYDEDEDAADDDSASSDQDEETESEEDDDDGTSESRYL